MFVHGHGCLWQIEGDFKAISWRHLFSGSLNSNGRENESKTTPNKPSFGGTSQERQPKGYLNR